MNKTKHTPGPWAVDNGTLAVPARFVRDASGNVLVYCDGPIETARVNARLIAAAPTLLAVARRVLPLLNDIAEGRDWEGCAVREQEIDIQLAIAEADGEVLEGRAGSRPESDFDESC